MAVTMAEISKLRKLTGAGMMDCKNALTETNGDIEAAKEIIRKKGQAVAAKREDREASEGCVLAAAKGDFAAIVALKCETDFVAKNDSFVALTKSILDAAIEAKATDLESVKALVVNGTPVANLIVDEIGKTGEKMELGYYEAISAPYTTAYIHPGNKLATIVGFNLADLMKKGESRLFKRVLKGMLPKNKLGAQLLRNVYIYGGSEHPHAAQTPKTIDINTLK